MLLSCGLTGCLRKIHATTHVQQFADHASECQSGPRSLDTCNTVMQRFACAARSRMDGATVQRAQSVVPGTLSDFCFDEPRHPAIISLRFIRDSSKQPHWRLWPAGAKTPCGHRPPALPDGTAQHGTADLPWSPPDLSRLAPSTAFAQLVTYASCLPEQQSSDRIAICIDLSHTKTLPYTPVFSTPNLASSIRVMIPTKINPPYSKVSR
jgi:hypothetical protein